MEYRLEAMGEGRRRPVIDIFNYFIETCQAAFQEKAVDYGFFDRLLAMCRGYPALVVRTETQGLAGFALMRPYHFGDSFQRTAEVTYFIIPPHTRQGLGPAILPGFCQ